MSNKKDILNVEKKVDAMKDVKMKEALKKDIKQKKKKTILK